MVSPGISNSDSSIVPDSAWNLLDSLVECWEQQVETESEVNLDSLLPDVSPGRKRWLLVELIKLDFERKFAADTSLRIESYLERHPEVRSDPDLLAELLATEAELRKLDGQTILPDEWNNRFPEIALESIRREENRDKPDSPNSANISGVSLSDPELILLTTGSRFQTTLDLLNTYPAGTLLSRYRILSVLGRGGMGVVYLARDEELDRLVAVKVLKSHDFGKSRLLSEARTVAQLKHESIIPVYDVGQTDAGDYFVVMEYSDHLSLQELIGSGTGLTIHQSISIASQVARGLDAAHRANIVHRDVKPANILVDSSGRARLTDFGLAVDEQQTTGSDRSGTIPYMAPEQLSADQSRVDRRSDIWSLGAVLFEMLTGKRPFPENDLSKLSDSIQNNQPAPPRQLNAAVPKWLDRVCMKCLEKDPKKRFSSAAEVADQLDAHSARPGWHWSWMAFVVLALALLTVVSWHAWNLNPSERSVKRIANDRICPVLRESCKLVVSFDSGEAIDLVSNRDYAGLFARIKKTLEKLNRNNPISLFTLEDTPLDYRHLGDDWLYWTTRVTLSDRPGRTDNDSKDTQVTLRRTTDLKLFFAISRDGRIQVGTSSTKAEDHLLVLAYHPSGLANYRRISTSESAHAMKPSQTFYSKAVYGTPVDATTTLDEKQNFLASVAVIIYYVAHDLGYMLEPDSVKTVSEIMASERLELANFFDQPVTVIDGRLTNMICRDIRNGAIENHRANGWGEPSEEFLHLALDIALAESHDRSALPNEDIDSVDRPVFNARDFNDGDPQYFRRPDGIPWRFDPVVDKKREFAIHQWTTQFDFPESITNQSVCVFSTQSDNRNSTRITVDGLSMARRPDEKIVSRANSDRDGISRSSVVSDDQKGAFQLTEWNISDEKVVLINRTFERVTVEALQQWSAVTPWYRIAVLGELDEKVVTHAIAKASIRRVIPYRRRTKNDGDDWQHLQFSPDWKKMLQQKELRSYERKLRPRFLVIPVSF